MSDIRWEGSYGGSLFVTWDDNEFRAMREIAKWANSKGLDMTTLKIIKQEPVELLDVDIIYEKTQGFRLHGIRKAIEDTFGDIGHEEKKSYSGYVSVIGDEIVISIPRPKEDE